MLYIHQYPDWTKFRFDSRKIMNALGQVRFDEGRLTGITQMLDDNEFETEILTKDIVATFAIDGMYQDTEQIKLQVQKREGADVHAYAVLIASSREKSEQFDEKNILDMYAALGKKITADYRQGDAPIYSRTDNSLIFQGPGPERLQHEMANFITWLNVSQIDYIIKAAIAQFWFLTIRPFNDTNGKIARAITNKIISNAEASGHAQYSINEQIFIDSEEYFKKLAEAQTSNGDLTAWILWFLSKVHLAIQASEGAIQNKITSIRFKSKKNAMHMTPREQKIVDAVFTGKLPQNFNVKEVAAFIGTSHDSALRDIQRLIDLGLVVASKKGGRSTRYSLVI